MTKLLAFLGALFTGGSLVSETVDEPVEEEPVEETEEVSERPQRKSRHNLENIKDNGFPYPSEEFLSTLTDDQLFGLTAFVDELNLNYDFSNMTDEELRLALDEIRTEMKALFEELEIELPERPERPNVEGRDLGGRAKGRHNRMNPESEESGTEEGSTT